MARGYSNGRPCNFQDMTGMRFGMLVVKEYAGRSQDKAAGSTWLCQCDCGKQSVVRASFLRHGRTKSCGCQRQKRGLAIAHQASRKHGLGGTPEYGIWRNMMRRCYNSKDEHYAIYGGRGITVCDRWHDVAAFVADMGKRPSNKYRLDRIDTNGNYRPDNCRWATQKEQCRNKRNNVVTVHDGERITLAALAERTGVKYRTLLYRFRNGLALVP